MFPARLQSAARCRSHHRGDQGPSMVAGTLGQLRRSGSGLSNCCGTCAHQDVACVATSLQSRSVITVPQQSSRGVLRQCRMAPHVRWSLRSPDGVAAISLSLPRHTRCMVGAPGLNRSHVTNQHHPYHWYNRHDRYNPSVGGSVVEALSCAVRLRPVANHEQRHTREELSNLLNVPEHDMFRILNSCRVRDSRRTVALRLP